MSILQIKDKDGNFIPINAIKGSDGKSAYEQAQEGGYTGTEEEFIALLNGVTNRGEHYTNLNNPHKVTKEQVGLGNVPNVATNDQTPTYEEAEMLETLTSGEKLSIALGKIKKAITGLISHIGDTKKHVGNATGGGAFIGTNAVAQSGGGAVGNYAQSLGLGGFAGGCLAFVKGGGGATGYEATATDGGGAVGCYAETSSGFAGGNNALTLDEYDDPIDAIQLGTGINRIPYTLKVYSYQLLDETGKIPSERLPIETGSYVGTGDSGSQNPNTLTFSFQPKIVMITIINEPAGSVSEPFVFGAMYAYRQYGTSAKSNRLTWGTNNVSWYTSNAQHQYNESGKTYNYIAIG